MLSLFKKKSPSPSPNKSPNKSSQKGSPSPKKSSKKSKKSNRSVQADVTPTPCHCTKGEKKKVPSYAVMAPAVSATERTFLGHNWHESGVKSAGEFMTRYAEMGPAGIKAEFKHEIENYKNPKFEHTAFDANPDKNRDNALIACLDDSRIVLSDKKYINASLTSELPNLKRKYILTQIPLDSTLADFWQMIYEQESCSYAFALAPELAKENANKPTAPFWPTLERESKKYGKITVTNIQETCLHEYDQGGMEMHWNVLSITREGGTDSVHKLLYMGYIFQWAPYFTEKRDKGFIKLMKQMSKECFNDKATVILMDEFSGTGNAASFMIVDAVRELFHKGEADLKLPSIVQWARRCRANAIRTDEEYLEVVKTIGLYVAAYDDYEDRRKFKVQYMKICGTEKEEKK